MAKIDICVFLARFEQETHVRWATTAKSAP